MALSWTDCYTFLHTVWFSPLDPVSVPIGGLIWMSIFAQDSPDSPSHYHCDCVVLHIWVLEGQMFMLGSLVQGPKHALEEYISESLNINYARFCNSKSLIVHST